MYIEPKESLINENDLSCRCDFLARSNQLLRLNFWQIVLSKNDIAYAHNAVIIIKYVIFNDALCTRMYCTYRNRLTTQKVLYIIDSFLCNRYYLMLYTLAVERNLHAFLKKTA